MTPLKVFFVLSLIIVLDANPIDREDDQTLMFGEHFQGDIKLTEEQKARMSGNSVNSRTGWTWIPYQWTKNAQGIVEIPYRISHNAGFSKWICLSSPNSK